MRAPAGSPIPKMKKFDPISLIGTLICVAALIGIFVHNAKSGASRRAEAARVAAQNATPIYSQPVEEIPVDAEAAALAKNASTEVVQRDPVTLEVPGVMQVDLDTMGRGVRAIRLEQYKLQSRDEAQRETPVSLGTDQVPFLGLSLPGEGLREVKEPEITEQSVTTRRLNASGTILFEETWSLPEGGAQAANPYALKYTLKATNVSQTPAVLRGAALSCGALPDFLSNEANTTFSRYFSGCVAYGRVSKNDAKTLDKKDITKKLTVEKQNQYLQTPANWVGVSSKYFLFALRDVQWEGGAPAVFAGFAPSQPRELLPTECFSAQAVLPEMSLMPGESRTLTVSGYAGPKSYQMLEPMGQGLPSILNMDLFFFWHYDWMGWLCKMLLKALNGIAGCFSPSFAYGLAIILITVIVKLVFLPLAWKSTRSMKKMSAIQPQLKELREKYKDDPQRMYYEQQKLFKENNVSQTGGCLPMLVQIPVFFAMFNTFRGAIEIRNAGFLWVDDLSMPDPIFGLPIHPLAILTGVTMFIQQKLQPMPDPNQAKMMNIMSLVFVVFFYNMPAGLTLYMTVNQLTSIAQMLLFRRLEKKAAAQPPAAPKKAKA